MGRVVRAGVGGVLDIWRPQGVLLHTPPAARNFQALPEAQADGCQVRLTRWGCVMVRVGVRDLHAWHSPALVSTWEAGGDWKMEQDLVQCPLRLQRGKRGPRLACPAVSWRLGSTAPLPTSQLSPSHDSFLQGGRRRVLSQGLWGPWRAEPALSWGCHTPSDPACVIWVQMPRGLIGDSGHETQAGLSWL